MLLDLHDFKQKIEAVEDPKYVNKCSQNVMFSKCNIFHKKGENVIFCTKQAANLMFSKAVKM